MDYTRTPSKEEDHDGTIEFSVKSTRLYIDDYLLPAVGAPTRWVKEIPIKINILAWKVSLDKLPTRLNLSLRGIEIPTISCPICSSAGESCSHLLFSCNMARILINKVARWWELDIPDLLSYEEWLDWFKVLRLPKGIKDILEDCRWVWLLGYMSALRIADVFGSTWFRMILPGYTSALDCRCVWLPGYTSALQIANIADVFGSSSALIYMHLFRLLRIKTSSSIESAL
ncbi:RNA-directed DNA polymerase, eukaryota [Tanacetum coccineum]